MLARGTDNPARAGAAVTRWGAHRRPCSGTPRGRGRTRGGPVAGVAATGPSLRCAGEALEGYRQRVFTRERSVVFGYALVQDVPGPPPDISSLHGPE
ncbi:hypothetical protein GCM10009639_37680 [Kitasatospora putterlickiae]|uniref:Uncharacterized protein n=1 Tax=Kitasatospora putterlickiae TaxID=221725 RepID=A0ABN1YA79_9ACTN